MEKGEKTKVDWIKTQLREMSNYFSKKKMIFTTGTSYVLI